MIDELTYPRPRAHRVAGGYADVITYPAPRTRVFPYVFRAGIANRRYTFTSPRCQGPGIIKDVHIQSGLGADLPNSSVEVGLAETELIEDGVTATAARPYELITELLDPFNQMAASGGYGFPISTLTMQANNKYFPLDIPIPRPQFYVTVSIVNLAATTTTIIGHIRVVEGVSPQALSFFL